MRTKRRLSAQIVIILLHAVLLLVTYILQAFLFPHLRILAVAPVILPVIAVGAALFEGSVSGGVVGLFAGVLCDLSYNQPTIMFTILLPVLGLAVGVLTDRLLTRGFPSYLAASTVSLLLIAFVQMFRLLFVERADVLALLLTALLQTVYSLLFTIPAYFILRSLGRRMQRTLPQ